MKSGIKRITNIEKRKVLKELLERHAQSRAKISSQCDTLISKKLVEDMIKELE